MATWRQKKDEFFAEPSIRSLSVVGWTKNISLLVIGLYLLRALTWLSPATVVAQFFSSCVKQSQKWIIVKPGNRQLVVLLTAIFQKIEY
jgi:hypothetical protein